MEVEFRHAVEADLADIVRTYNATIPSRLVTADLEPVTVESRRDWFREHDEVSRPLWIILCDKEYAGWISFSSFYGRPAYDGTVELSLYIDEPFRKRGLGKACLEKAESAAPAMGVHTLLGFIFSHNTVSLRLFERMGYEKWARLPAVANMEGVMRDLVIVGKKINSGKAGSQ